MIHLHFDIVKTPHGVYNRITVVDKDSVCKHLTWLIGLYDTKKEALSVVHKYHDVYRDHALLYIHALRTNQTALASSLALWKEENMASRFFVATMSTYRIHQKLLQTLHVFHDGIEDVHSYTPDLLDALSNAL